MGKTQTITNLAIFLMVCISIPSSQSAPAFPAPIQVKQPNGEIITIMMHGDENAHFITTVDGYVITQNKNGYYVYVEEKKCGKTVTTKIVVHDQEKRTKKEIEFLKKKSKKNPQSS